MWKFFACHVLRNHTYEVRVQQGRVFLECSACSRRTQGWNLIKGSTTTARHALRLLLDESAMAQARPRRGLQARRALQPRVARDYSERFTPRTELRLHLEI